MNKSRSKQPRMSIMEMSILIAAAVIVMVAGVTHAWLKNSHVEVMRTIDKTQRSIKDHQDSVNSLQVKIDRKLNIYELRDDLERAGSELAIIPTTSIEKIPANSITDFADNQTRSPDIAQITP